MNDQDAALIRAAYVALSGQGAGWLNDSDTQKVLRALEARLESDDGDWLEA